MRQRRTLYHRVAGIKTNNLPRSDPESVKRLWRYLPSSSGITRVPIKTTPTRVTDFMSFDATETSFIPLCSWRRAQQSPAIGSRIGLAAVEKSAIELWDCRGTYKDNPPTRVSDFMGFDGTETSFIPLRSWRRAQQPPAIRSRIGPAVVEESAIEPWDRQHPTLFSPVTS